MPPKPKPAFPDPAATLPGEVDVLANVLADLSDHDAKLVYADWLEEHDDKRGPLLRKFVTAYCAGKKLPKVTSAPKPWRDLVGITLITKIRGTALAPKTDQVLALVLPAISFQCTRAADATLSIGVSKLGGRPDLPAKTKWPKSGRRPLAFVGQFNCADLHASPVGRELPDAGLLSVFAAWDKGNGFEMPDEEEEECLLTGTESWRVFYFPDTAELVRREPGIASRFRPCRLEFTETLALPGWYPPMRELGALGGSAVCEAYHAILGEMYPRDHLLGPQMYDRAYGRLDDATARQRPRRLLTLWSNDLAGWSCYDDGAVYLTLGQDDLRKRRFHRARIGRHGC